MSEKEFTKNWFQPDAIARALHHLKDAHELHFLEVGTFEGRSACWFLDNYDCDLVTIDPCTDYPIPGHEYINSSMYPLIVKNLKPYGERVTFYKDYSANILPKMLPDYFDFIFIDGDHRRDSVATDAELAWPLLKVGGIMAFDDYTWGYNPKVKDNPSSPHDAIDDFVRFHVRALQVIHRNYHVIVRKFYG